MYYFLASLDDELAAAAIEKHKWEKHVEGLFGDRSRVYRSHPTVPQNMLNTELAIYAHDLGRIIESEARRYSALDSNGDWE